MTNQEVTKTELTQVSNLAGLYIILTSISLFLGLYAEDIGVPHFGSILSFLVMFIILWVIDSKIKIASERENKLEERIAQLEKE